MKAWPCMRTLLSQAILLRSGTGQEMRVDLRNFVETIEKEILSSLVSERVDLINPGAADDNFPTMQKCLPKIKSAQKRSRP